MLLDENLFEDMLEPDDIVQVDVVDDQPVLDGPESGEEMGIANMLTDTISNTWDSVNEVNDLIANLSDEHKDFEDSLDKINADNMENIGVLQGLLSQVSPNVDNIKDGEMEVQQDLSDSVDESFNDGYVDRDSQEYKDAYKKVCEMAATLADMGSEVTDPDLDTKMVELADQYGISIYYDYDFIGVEDEVFYYSDKRVDESLNEHVMKKLKESKMDDLMSKDDILEYAKTNGNEAAANLLLLCGPDGFVGDLDTYNELMSSLEGDKMNESLENIESEVQDELVGTIDVVTKQAIDDSDKADEVVDKIAEDTGSDEFIEEEEKKEPEHTREAESEKLEDARLSLDESLFEDVNDNLEESNVMKALKAGRLSYDAHPYNGSVTDIVVDNGKVNVFGNYNGEEKLVAQFDSMSDLNNHYDSKYFIIDLDESLNEDYALDYNIMLKDMLGILANKDINVIIYDSYQGDDIYSGKASDVPEELGEVCSVQEYEIKGNSLYIDVYAGEDYNYDTLEYNESLNESVVDSTSRVYYMFPLLDDDDIYIAENNFGLRHIPQWDDDEDTTLYGELQDIEDFADSYLDYELVQGYLFDEDGEEIWL